MRKRMKKLMAGCVLSMALVFTAGQAMAVSATGEVDYLYYVTSTNYMLVNVDGMYCWDMSADQWEPMLLSSSMNADCHVTINCTDGVLISFQDAGCP